MRNARIVVRDITEARAVEVLKDVRKLTGGKVELDLPDPPDLYEKEFDNINNLLSDIEDVASGFDGFDHYGEVSTPRQVESELNRLERHILKLETLVRRLRDVRFELAERLKVDHPESVRKAK